MLNPHNAMGFPNPMMGPLMGMGMPMTMGMNGMMGGSLNPFGNPHLPNPNDHRELIIPGLDYDDLEEAYQQGAIDNYTYMQMASSRGGRMGRGRRGGRRMYSPYTNPQMMMGGGMGSMSGMMGGGYGSMMGQGGMGGMYDLVMLAKALGYI